MGPSRPCRPSSELPPTAVRFAARNCRPWHLISETRRVRATKRDGVESQRLTARAQCTRAVGEGAASPGRATGQRPGHPCSTASARGEGSWEPSSVRGTRACGRSPPAQPEHVHPPGLLLPEGRTGVSGGARGTGPRRLFCREWGAHGSTPLFAPHTRAQPPCPVTPPHPRLP